MGDIAQYKDQVSPEQPRGPSPFQLLSRLTLPDTRVEQAVTEGITSLGQRISEMAIKASAADQAQEVARARAEYFSQMTDWARNLTQSDLDPKDYRDEFTRRSNEAAGEISKSFRYGDSLEQFSTWRLEQDVPLIGETTKQQLMAMNDRFGATLQKDLGVLKSNPAYLATVLRNIQEAERVVGQSKTEELRQNAYRIAEAGQVMQEGEKIGSAAMMQRLQNMNIYTHLDQEDRKKAIADLVFNENVKAQVLVEEDRKHETSMGGTLLKIVNNGSKPNEIFAALKELEQKPFNNGDTTYQWQQRFRGELPAGSKDWDSAPPDPLVLNNYYTYRQAVQNPGTRLPDDPAFGSERGQRATVSGLNTFMVDNHVSLGKVYRSARDNLLDWQASTNKDSDKDIQDLVRTEGFRRKYGSDEAKNLQLIGQWATERRKFFADRNPTEKEKADWLMAKYQGLPNKPVTEDTPTSGAGGELALQLWNDQYSNKAWKDTKAVHDQVDALALAQRKRIGDYLGRNLNSLPELTSPPTKPGQQGFLMGDKGMATFYLKDGSGQVQTYAYVPEKFDGKQYSGNLTLKRHVGGKWTDLPAPEVTPNPQGFIQANTIKGMDPSAIVNKIRELKTQRARTLQFIATQDRILSDPRPGEDPTQAYGDKAAKQKELEKIDNNITNLQNALAQRGAQ